MTKRLLILSITAAIMLTVLAGCRTGEYKFDLDIYEKMPQLLMAEPELEGKLFITEEGTPKLEFEKGEMHVWFAYKLDESTRMKACGKAFEIFHDQYINHPDAKNKNGEWHRETIGCRGWVDETELYVLTWDLEDELPVVESNRYGNFL